MNFLFSPFNNASIIRLFSPFWNGGLWFQQNCENENIVASVARPPDTFSVWMRARALMRIAIIIEHQIKACDLWIVYSCRQFASLNHFNYILLHLIWRPFYLHKNTHTCDVRLCVLCIGIYQSFFLCIKFSVFVIFLLIK